jgi:succinyl-diaminopimelate desuccinylase
MSPVDAVAADRQAEAVQLAMELIACDTTNPPGRELAACQIIERHLAERGVRATIQQLGDERANLVARVRGSQEGPALMLCGHVDVVPADPGDWTSPPFDPTLLDGRIVGRGSADMKSAIAAMTVALGNLARKADALAGDVVLLCTSGEEVDSSGARAVARDHGMDDVEWLVIGEPTDLDVGVGHKGALWIRVETHGVAAHGAQPEQGVNAVNRMLEWLGDPASLADLLVADPHPVLGSASVSLNQISGGTAPNIVPDRCRMTVDFRTLPGEEHASVLLALGLREPSAKITVLRDAAAVAAESDSLLVAAAHHAVLAATGREPALRGLPYVTDGSVLGRTLGAEVVLLGPGDERLAHQANEWVSVADVETAVTCYEEIAIRMVGRDG